MRTNNVKESIAFVIGVTDTKAWYLSCHINATMPWASFPKYVNVAKLCKPIDVKTTFHLTFRKQLKNVDLLFYCMLWFLYVCKFINHLSADRNAFKSVVY